MKPRKTIFPCASKSERNRNTNPRKNCEGARQLTTSLARQKLARKDKRERKRRKEREREILREGGGQQGQSTHIYIFSCVHR